MSDQDEKRVGVKVAYNYFQAGNWERALNEYKKLLALDPMDFLVHNMLAEIYSRMNNIPAAIFEYLNAAKLLRAANNLEKALLAYCRILKIDAEHEEAHAEIDIVVQERLDEVETLCRQGEWEQAQDICERLEERLPDHSGVKEKLAEVVQRRSRHPSPAAAASRSGASQIAENLDREQLVQNLFAMAKMYEDKQSWDEAVEAYITILRFQPNDETARGKLHTLYRQITQHDKSEEVWSRISSEEKLPLENTKQPARETKPAENSTAKIPEEIPKAKQMDNLRQQAEATLRRSVEDRRERDRSSVEPGEESSGSAGGESAANQSQRDQEIGVLLTQAHMYIQENMLSEAMRLCQRVLELDPQNREVRGLLQKIFERKKL